MRPAAALRRSRLATRADAHPGRGVLLGISIDTSALEEAVGRIDPENLADLSSQLEGGLFEPHKTPEQLATLERLETMLALVEGWVDDVVTQATAP